MHFLLLADEPARAVEERREWTGEGGVKVVARPWNPIVTVEDVWIGVVPRPEELLDADDIERNVEQNHREANCNNLWRLQFISKTIGEIEILGLLDDKLRAQR